MLELNEPWAFAPPIAAFWRQVRPGIYQEHESRQLALRFLDIVEAELSKVISPRSHAYWLHLYRRLSPGQPHPDADPATTYNTRAILESAFQKYATSHFCDGIAFSQDVILGEILNGFYDRDDRCRELASKFGLDKPGRLVLKNFSVVNLQEIYYAERLAYLTWKFSAKLRIIGKGAKLIVDRSGGISDTRSSELAFLVTSYDNRHQRFETTAQGVIFASTSPEDAGFAFVPVYNVANLDMSELVKRFELLAGREEPANGKYNFTLAHFDLRGYYKAHLPFADSFHEQHKVSYKAVLFVISCLLSRLFHQWLYQPGALVRDLMRAYYGPAISSHTRGALREMIPLAEKVLQDSRPEEGEFDAAIAFLSLQEFCREIIDLKTQGPLSVFLPIEVNTDFVDFAWIERILFNLFTA
jgi:hypothetical protein